MSEHEYLKQLSAFEYNIKRQKIVSSYDVAENTIQLFITSIEDKEIHENQQIFERLYFILENLNTRFPSDHLIQNICSVVSAKIENAYKSDEVYKSVFHSKNRHTELHRASTFVNSPSLMDFLIPIEKETDYIQESEIKSEIIEIFNELLTSLQGCYLSISQQAKYFLCNGDIIFTIGYSKAVLNFLSASHLHPTVLLAERAPDYDGYQMAKELAKVDIHAIVISDASIFAILPKVQKIIVSARFVLANGGIISHSLTGPLALAAKHHAIPFIVLYWSMKLTSEFPSPNTSFDILDHPNSIASQTTSPSSPIFNPANDYVPPELITLMIGQQGAHSPSDVFSIVQSNYQHDSF